MSYRTINAVFAPTITNILLNLEYIIFREKANNGMLCWVHAADSVGDWGGIGSWSGKTQV